MRERIRNAQVQNWMSSHWALPLCLTLLPSQLPWEFSKSLLGKDYPRSVGPRMPGTESWPLWLFPTQEFLRLLQKKSCLLGNTINKLYLQKAGITLLMFQWGEKYSKYELDSEAWGVFPHSNKNFYLNLLRGRGWKPLDTRQIFLFKCTHIHTFIFTWATSMKEVPSAFHIFICWNTPVNPFYHSSFMQYDN